MGAGRFFTIFTNHEPIDMPEQLLNLGLSQRNRQTEEPGGLIICLLVCDSSQGARRCTKIALTPLVRRAQSS